MFIVAAWHTLSVVIVIAAEFYGNFSFDKDLLAIPRGRIASKRQQGGIVDAAEMSLEVLHIRFNILALTRVNFAF